MGRHNGHAPTLGAVVALLVLNGCSHAAHSRDVTDADAAIVMPADVVSDAASGDEGDARCPVTPAGLLSMPVDRPVSVGDVRRFDRTAGYPYSATVGVILRRDPTASGQTFATERIGACVMTTVVGQPAEPFLPASTTTVMIAGLTTLLETRTAGYAREWSTAPFGPGDTVGVRGMSGGRTTFEFSVTLPTPIRVVVPAPRSPSDPLTISTAEPLRVEWTAQCPPPVVEVVMFGSNPSRDGGIGEQVQINCYAPGASGRAEVPAAFIARLPGHEELTLSIRSLHATLVPSDPLPILARGTFDVFFNRFRFQ